MAKRILCGLLLFTVIAAPAGTAVAGMDSRKILDIPPIPQSTSIKNLCGPTVAEMILTYFGNSDQDQYAVGKAITEMIPAYKEQHPKAADAKEFVWPHYQETYQPILARYFQQQGFKTKNTRTWYDKNTGAVSPKRFEEFMNFVRKGVPVLIHIEKHYMLAVGYDDTEGALYINDPSNGKQLSVSYADFSNRNAQWYRKKDRKTWDGRFLAVWQ